MKSCYIGHEYHRKTASTRFLSDFLEASSDSFARHDTLPSPEALAAFDFDALAAEDYDVICVFQLEMLARELADRRIGKRLIFVPMYDGCWRLGDDYWAHFVGRDDIRVINFSSTLHTRIARLGVASFRFQYFPEPVPEPVLPRLGRRGTGPSRAFFWQRTDDPSWETVRTLFADHPDLPFHLHLAGDPSLRAAVDVEAEKAARPLTVSTWFEDPSEYRRIVEGCDVYVAPRAFEGIGMSFLEAMAAGKCVVAPDNPTMNEYITHGVNGLLYDLADPQPLDLSRAAEIGARARRSVRHGHRTWSWDLGNRLRDLLLQERLDDPAAYQEIGAYVRAGKGRDFPVRRQGRAPLPSVSVAVVCYNSAAEIEPTLHSIFAQTYPKLEIVVVDGASTDGTTAILERHRSRFAAYVSEPDKGVYDAMNKAARMATGDYIIFINAGDFFHLPTALEEAMGNVFGGPGAWLGRRTLPDFVVGHHVYLHDDGTSALHKAEDFERTWQALQAGTFRPGWWGGIPCHQATLTRRRLLAEDGYDLSFQITADHNFMFSQRRKGRSFVHANAIIATYVGGGLSQKRAHQCIRESLRVSTENSPRTGRVERYYRDTFGAQMLIADIDRFLAEADLIRRSGLFHEEWYRARHIRPGDRFQEPVEHYLAVGAAQGAWPNPFFDTRHYLLRNSDVARSGLNPFVHYLQAGRQQHRPFYDWESPGQAMLSLKRLYRWTEQDLGDLEAAIAETPPAALLAMIREP